MTARLVSLLVMVLVALAACSGGADSASTGAAEAPAMGQPESGDAGGDADGGSAARPGSEAADGDVASPVSVRVQPVHRIRRAEVVLEVEELSAAAARVRAIATDLQGYVADESIALREGVDAGVNDGSEIGYRAPGEARLVLRIPEPDLDEAIASVVGVGTELSRFSTEQDVTADIVDLDSRIATQQRSVARVRELLDQAEDLGDVVLLESELSRRESDLESLQAQRASLADRAALSTLTVVLRTPDRAAQADDDADEGFLAGLEAGWDALLASTGVLLTAVGALLPFAIVTGLFAVPLLALRRRRRSAAAGSGSAPAVG